MAKHTKLVTSPREHPPVVRSCERAQRPTRDLHHARRLPRPSRLTRHLQRPRREEVARLVAGRARVDAHVRVRVAVLPVLAVAPREHAALLREGYRMVGPRGHCRHRRERSDGQRQQLVSRARAESELPQRAAAPRQQHAAGVHRRVVCVPARHLPHRLRQPPHPLKVGQVHAVAQPQLPLVVVPAREDVARVAERQTVGEPRVHLHHPHPRQRPHQHRLRHREPADPHRPLPRLHVHTRLSRLALQVRHGAVLHHGTPQLHVPRPRLSAVFGGSAVISGGAVLSSGAVISSSGTLTCTSTCTCTCTCFILPLLLGSLTTRPPPQPQPRMLPLLHPRQRPQRCILHGLSLQRRTHRSPRPVVHGRLHHLVLLTHPRETLHESASEASARAARLSCGCFRLAGRRASRRCRRGRCPRRQADLGAILPRIVVEQAPPVDPPRCGDHQRMHRAARPVDDPMVRQGLHALWFAAPIPRSRPPL
mmetsp:Transcript_15615/g.49787  ORF Transcript_15615/g.49787 Transcript_15615/m.49787 type:complete len:479 (+) Transcript_15615:1238-2674(+)